MTPGPAPWIAEERCSAVVGGSAAIPDILLSIRELMALIFNMVYIKNYVN
jgi:hypothetical protein